MTVDPNEIELPLRDRIPEYLASFGVMWAVIIVIGAGIGIFSSLSVAEGIAYTSLGIGIVLLLAGGATGGGYASMGMGAAGAIVGGRSRHDDDYDDSEVRRGKLKRVSASDRLRRGLRPERNPRAFWQVIGGFVNLAATLVILSTFVY